MYIHNYRIDIEQDCILDRTDYSFVSTNNYWLDRYRHSTIANVCWQPEFRSNVRRNSLDIDTLKCLRIGQMNEQMCWWRDLIYRSPFSNIDHRLNMKIQYIDCVDSSYVLRQVDKGIDTIRVCSRMRRGWVQCDHLVSKKVARSNYSIIKSLDSALLS